MESQKNTDALPYKLYLLLLGSKAPKRNVEQHDYFFGIAQNLRQLIPDIQAFWPEAGDSIHIDAWREVTLVDGYKIEIELRKENFHNNSKKLFFINLGGYQSNKLEEQHYTILLVRDNQALAVQDSKKTVFFKTNTVKGANSHIDEKYGIDIDDIYPVEDILTSEHKDKFCLIITPATGLPDDEIHLGYLTLKKLAERFSSEAAK
jgi:hypothetical protein